MKRRTLITMRSCEPSLHEETTWGRNGSMKGERDQSQLPRLLYCLTPSSQLLNSRRTSRMASILRKQSSQTAPKPAPGGQLLLFKIYNSLPNEKKSSCPNILQTGRRPVSEIISSATFASSLCPYLLAVRLRVIKDQKRHTFDGSSSIRRNGKGVAIVAVADYLATA